MKQKSIICSVVDGIVIYAQPLGSVHTSDRSSTPTHDVALSGQIDP